MKRRQPTPPYRAKSPAAVRRRARLRIGSVKPSRIITPKPLRKPKYKDTGQED